MFSKVMGFLFFVFMAVACYFLATIQGPEQFADAEGAATTQYVQAINASAAKAALPDNVSVAKAPHASALIQAQD
jgi:hypothetical protein